MPVPISYNPPYNPGVPSWVAGVSATINLVLQAPWSFGQRTKRVPLTAAQFGVPALPANALDTLMGMLNEYRAAGWRVTWAVTARNAGGAPTAIEIAFARWNLEDPILLTQEEQSRE